MAEENFNWLENYLEIQSKKDVKNSSAFKLLNENNIDTNELTNHEKVDGAGVIELNIKDKELKEEAGYDYAQGLLSFVKDIPKSTILALTNAFINGVDVGINVMPVLYKALSHTNAPLKKAYEAGDVNGFNAAFFNGVKDISDRIAAIRASNEKIAEKSNKATQFVAIIFQDTPYAIPIYKKLRQIGLPNWMALPVSYGIGAGFAYSEEEYPTFLLNSEQILELKKTVGVLEGSSDEVIWNAVGRITEGTTLTAAFGALFGALKFAKNNIPKFSKKKVIKTASDVATLTAGGTVLATSIMGEAKSEENIKTKIQKLKDASGHPNEFPATDADFAELAQLSPNPDEFPSTDYDFEVILGQEREPITDAEIDKAYGKGSVEKEFERLKKLKNKSDSLGNNTISNLTENK